MFGFGLALPRASVMTPGGPTLSLNFVGVSALDPGITFTRALNTATYFDSAGLLQTANANVPRFDYDPVTLASRGLLIEEARTNLLLQSATLSTQSVTVSATAYTLSFYGTGTVALSGTSTGSLVGSGAFPTRSTLTFTPTAGTLTLTVTGTVQYAQLEAGAFATSYIPTTTTSLTRNADAATMTGANFSSWYNQAAGTMFVEGIAGPNIASVTRVWTNVTDGTSNNRFNIQQTASGAFQAVTTTSGVSDFNPTTSGTVATGTVFRTALALASGDKAQVRDGGAVATGTLNIPTSGITQLALGYNLSAGLNVINSHIRRLQFYPRRLSNAELQAITG